MIEVDQPHNETERIEALKRYNILDTPPDGNFDRITKLASSIFNVPIAIISLVDTDRIWFKSSHGIQVSQIERTPGLCASAILSSDMYVIGNACEDPRSLANPLVAGEFGLRFYAAVPLQTEDQYNLGTLCVIDKVPREFSENDKQILKQLGGIVMDEMELRLSLRKTVASVKQLSSEISYHLDRTINNIEESAEAQNGTIRNYLEASKMFLTNVNDQLDML